MPSPQAQIDYTNYNGVDITPWLEPEVEETFPWGKYEPSQPTQSDIDYAYAQAMLEPGNKKQWRRFYNKNIKGNPSSVSSQPGGQYGWMSKVPWSGIYNTVSGVGNTLNLDRDDGDNMSNVEDMVAKVGSSIPHPIVSAAFTAAGLGAKAANWLGTNISYVKKNDARKIGLDPGTGFGNGALGFLLDPLIWPGALVPKTKTAYTQRHVDDWRGAYTGIGDASDIAMRTGDKRYIFGRGRVDRYIDNTNTRSKAAEEMYLNNIDRIRTAGDTSNFYENQLMNDYYGNNLSMGYTQFVKNGTKLPSHAELAKIFAARKPKVEEIEAFKEGGVIGIDTNIIPEGALHAHKNNLEETNPDLDKVTEKGIPVIVTDETGDYKQVAEIEKEELVLTRDLTSKIEELWKENTPESMLEAGKLLAQELMENTQDNTEVLDGNNSD